MKINCNRDYETMESQGFYKEHYAKGENMHMGGYPEAYGNNYGMGYYNEMMGETIPGVICPPVYECPQETVCHRYICHEVPHIMPCNTRIINHHIYRHTYTPTYSCCEENEVQNVYERRCC